MGLFSRTPKINTDEAAVAAVLTRGVENVIPRELALKKLRSGERLRVYLGIDPTGAKLHLGHSVPLRKLREFGELGHEVIFLVGSFTAMVGDPTGRETKREPLTRERIEENFKTYKTQASKILDFSNVELRYNHEWLEKMQFADIMKLASHFTVQQMLERDMFRERMKREEDLSPNEFFYPLMQGYDSVVLDVDCEVGGNDQLFNMLAGRKLQRAFGRREKFILTTKLIEGTDGRKMSKTYDNCVYLEDTPSDMYGKVMSIKDELVPTSFEVATDVTTDDIAQILAGHPKEAKMRLACEIVTLYHGKDAAAKAESDWHNTFIGGGVPADVPVVKNGKLRDIVKDISTSELRRLVDQGAVSSVLSGKKVKSIDTEIANDVMRIGKHKFLKTH